MRAVLCLFLTIVPLCAQTAETSIFRVMMLPGNLVPPVNNTNRATADVYTTVVRDGSGQIVSGTLDVLVRTALAAASNVTALDVRSGAAGQNGAIAIGSGLSSSAPRAILNGTDAIRLQLQATPDNAAAVTALRGLFQDPSRLYLNLATADRPDGALRGQFLRTQSTVLMGMLSSQNVVPAVAVETSGFAQVVAIGTRDGNGNWTSAGIYMAATCTSSDPTIFNGFHLHSGAEGVAGPIGITGPLLPNQQTNPDDFAAIGPSFVEVTVSNAVQLAALNALFFNPGQLYLDLHTTGTPNGIARAQLRRTDAMTFPLLLESGREAHRTTTAAAAPALVTIATLRNEDGSPAAATVVSGLNLRFAGPTHVLGLYIHDGAAQEEGIASVPLTTNFTVETGYGAFFGWSPPVYNLAAIEDLIKNPESHYLSVHTLADPVGGARAQFGPPVAGRATVMAALAAPLDKNAAAVAPGGLVTIFGSRLVKVATDLSGWSGRRLPVSLNGTTVTIGGFAAPLLYVGPNQINAQVPAEVRPGTAMVVVDNGAGAGTALPVNVAAVAPSIFFTPVPTVFRNVNFSVVSAANPARAGEAIVVYATGLGQTSPAVATGVLTPVGTLARTPAVTVTIGGRAANVIYSIAAPLTAGVYQVAVTVPAGVSGAVQLLISESGAASNTVTINVQ